MDRPWLIGIFAFVLIAIVAGAYPSYRSYQSWTAENLARSADELIKQGNVVEALEALTKAIRKDQDNYEVIRMRAMIYTQLKHQDCLIIWTRLRQLHGLNAEDRREYARAAVLFGQVDLADQIMAGAEGRNAPIEDILLRYLIAFNQGNYKLAEDLAREALRKDPNDQSALINMAHALLLQKSPRAREEAADILEKMQEGTDLYSLTALRLVASDEDILTKSRLDACKKIFEHPETGFNERLFVRKIRIKLEPELKDEIIDITIAEATDGTPYEKAQISRWLNQIDQSHRIAELLDFEAAKNRRAHLLILLDALAAQDLWDEIETALQDPDIALEPFFRKLFIFRVNLEKGRLPDADATWSRLIATGANYEDRLRTTADYVYKLGRLDYARKAYQIMSRNSLVSRAGYIGLVKVAKRELKLTELITLLKTMIEKFPSDEAASNEYNYYRLLAKQEIGMATNSATNLYKINPKMMAFRITLALAYMRNGKPADAYNMLNINKLEWDELEDLRKVIRAATLIQNGQATGAKGLLESINRDALFPEELELIHPY